MRKRIAMLLCVVFTLQLLLPGNGILKSVSAEASDGHGKATMESGIVQLEGSNPSKVGDWLYYVKKDYNYSLFKLDGKGKSTTKVVENHSAAVFAVGDRVYYSNEYDNYRLYSVKSNGKEKRAETDSRFLIQKISGKRIYGYNSGYLMEVFDAAEGKVIGTCEPQNFIAIDGEYTYYYSEDQTALVKGDLFGKEIARSTSLGRESGVRVLEVKKGKVFYTYENQLYSSNFENLNPTKIFDKYVYYLSLVGNTLFVGDSEYNLYRMGLDGKGKKALMKGIYNILKTNDESYAYVLAKAGTYKIDTTGKLVAVFKTNLSVSYTDGKATYGRVLKSNFGVARMKADGSSDKILAAGEMNQVVLRENKIFYATNDGLFSMNFDGTGKLSLWKGNVTSFSMLEDGILIRSMVDWRITYNTVTYDGKKKAVIDEVVSLTTYNGKVYYISGWDNSIRERTASDPLDKVVVYSPCNEIFTEDDGIYYTSNNQTYAFSEIGEGGAITRFVGDFKNITYIGDNFIQYYTFDEATYESHTYTIKKDGTGLVEEPAISNRLGTFGDWIYFHGEEDQILYKIMLDGSNKQMVTDTKRSSYVHLTSEGLYIANKDGSVEWVPNSGERRTFSFSGFSIYSCKVIDDILYYEERTKGKNSEKIYKLN